MCRKVYNITRRLKEKQGKVFIGIIEPEASLGPSLFDRESAFVRSSWGKSAVNPTCPRAGLAASA
ncbi:MAG: hypothetical protein ACNYWU_06730, partial [Desulfobacterales bacterium]